MFCPVWIGTLSLNPDWQGLGVAGHGYAAIAREGGHVEVHHGQMALPAGLDSEALHGGPHTRTTHRGSGTKTIYTGCY